MGRNSESTRCSAVSARSAHGALMRILPAVDSWPMPVKGWGLCRKNTTRPSRSSSRLARKLALADQGERRILLLARPVDLIHRMPEIDNQNVPGFSEFQDKVPAFAQGRIGTVQAFIR